jgi:nucleoid DNA-binding protein
MPNSKTSNNSNVIHPDSFIHALAKEAGFTLGDTRLFWKAFVTLTARAIAANKILTLSGLGKLYTKDIPPRKLFMNFGPNKGGYADVGASKRVTLKISGRLKKALEEGKEDFDIDVDSDLDN